MQKLNMPETISTKEGQVLSSDRLGWEQICVSKWQDVAPQEAYEESLSNHLIVIHMTPEPVKVIERSDGLHNEGIAKPGEINLFSAGEMSYCRWDRELSFLRLDLPPAFVREVASKTDFQFSGNIELHRQLRTHDPKLFQLSQWLVDELQNDGAGGKLYIDSLTNLLTVHLLQNYVSTERNRAPLPSKLTEQQVARAIEYMHSHLERDISLEELSAAVNISASYLVRLFKQATGLTPHQYFINLRIHQAKVLIQSRNFTMGEIAAKLGFADQSHMNRHFKRITGLTPREFQSNIR